MLNTPQDPIVLPAKVKAEVKKVKEQMAINEQELITIQKTRIAEEYAVRELLKSKIEMQAENSKIENKLNENREKLVSIETRARSLSDENSRLESSIAGLKTSLDEKTKELEGKELNIEAREQKVAMDTEKLKTDQSNLMAETLKVVNYIEELRTVIAKFNL